MRRASECGLKPGSADPQRKAHVVAIFRSALTKSPDSADLTLGMAQAKLGLATDAEINDASTLIKRVLDTNPKKTQRHTFFAADSTKPKASSLTQSLNIEPQRNCC